MKRIALISMVFLLSASIALAQDICESDFDCNGAVDANDVGKFLEDFGRNQYNNPCPPCVPPILVPKTGLTICRDESGVIDCEGTGQDGEYQNGVERFIDNGDGTVTDTFTNLVWLKMGFGAQTTWMQALSNCNGLSDGEYGLTDGSSDGDWRLPNINELKSLGYAYPFPFIGIQRFSHYWSSSHMTDLPYVHTFNFGESTMGWHAKTTLTYVIPVRGGH